MSSVNHFQYKLCRSTFLIALTFTLTSVANAGDWTQWRGNDRNGVASDSPSLVNRIPEDGLKATWISEPIGSGKNEGGWGSPVVVNFPGDNVAEQRVYLFTHRRVQIADPPKKKFPWLSPDKRVGMSDAEYAEYEVKRRDEDEAIAKAFVFRETIYCLNAVDGKEIWKNENDSVYTRFPQSGSPTVVDGRLYILGAGGHVRSVDALTGKSIWKVRLPVEFRDEFWQSSFLIVDDLAIFLAGHLYAEWMTTLALGQPQYTSLVAADSKVYYALEGVLCVEATPKEFRPLFNAKVDDAGLLNTEDALRELHGINALAKENQGQAEKLYQSKIGKHGPLQCATPAIADGKIYVRLKNALACYDLRAAHRD